MKRKGVTIVLVLLLILLASGCTSHKQVELTEVVTSEAAQQEEDTATEMDAATETDTVANYSVPSTEGVPVVYMTSSITPESLENVYLALGIEPKDSDKVAVKVSTGEPPASNYLRQELIGDFVKSLNGTYVECNTAYGGQRTGTEMHYQVAADHGFEPIVLMDDEGDMEIPIEGGLQLATDTVGLHLQDFNFYVVLSHFKGHQIAGYGGALKQLSIGCASFAGKNLIHTAGKSATSWFGGNQDAFLESMADASKGVVDFIENRDGGQVIYINVMNRLSIDCDCNGNPAEPDIHDIGILASLDPVALDQACIDLIYKAEGNESFLRRLNAQNGTHVIEAAERIHLGRRTYTLESIDE